MSNNQFFKKTAIGLSWIPVALAMTDVVQISRIKGHSMRPTLNPQDGRYDWVLVNKIQISNCKRNDIILLRSPLEPMKVFCKRVKAVAFDEIKNNSTQVAIPRGHVWVEGDNLHSIDSKNFGPVSNGLILGRVMCVIWPPTRWGTDLDQWHGRDILTYDHHNNDKRF